MKKKNTNVKNKNHKLILKNLRNHRIKKIFNHFKNSLNLNKKFAVAVSGGADSLSLVFLAKCYAIEKKLDIKFYIVDHRLRKNSSTEAKKVFEILRKFKIESKILVWRGKKPLSNIQANARNKRYSLLATQCKKDKINDILLGHQVDDLYENFLIRLLRGSGLKGLTSFGKISEYKLGGINILRPLIDFEKKELIHISNTVFNFYIEDPSNLNEDFKRIRIRNLISKLKKEGLDIKKMKLTIDNLKNADRSINFYVNYNLENNAKFIKQRNQFLLNKNFFDQPNEIIFRSLSFLLKTVSQRYYLARGKNVMDLIMKIKSNKISKKVTLGGCFVERINETLLISRENSSKS